MGNPYCHKKHYGFPDVLLLIDFFYVTEPYETNWMSTVGKNINEVERLAAKKIGCKYAVALSAGTAFKMTPNQQESIIQTIRNCFA